MRWSRAIGGAAIAVLLLVITQQRFGASDLTAKVDELEREKVRLIDYVRRLSTSRRVAQVTVLEQVRGELGSPVNRLLWQEIDADGIAADPLYVDAVGDLVYFEAYVIKFQHELVAQGDPDRGTSLTLFRRVFGDRQAPDSVSMLDHPKARARDDLASPLAAEASLWTRFWELVDDPKLASEYGIRVAQCEAPAVRLQSGQVWEVTLDASGGLNLRKVRDADQVARSGYGGP